MEYLYLIQCNQYVKIGISNDVEYRLMHLQIGNPYPLALLEKFEFANAFVVEGILHKRFAHAWVRGEWFQLTEVEIKELVQICQNFDETKIDVKQFVAANFLRSALDYCKEAGLLVELGNQDGALVLVIHGVNYDNEHIKALATVGNE